MTHVIEVNSNAAPAHLMSLLRDGLLMLSAWASGKGYIDALTGTHAVAFVMGVGTILWRQQVVHRNHKRLVRTAWASPDSIAVVK